MENGSQDFAVLASEVTDIELHDDMLRSTARFARLAFGAAAASVFLHQAENDSLVFEASSGIGEDRLIGVAIPGHTGIAGWVFSTGEAIIVHDVGEDTRFDRQIADDTGLIPDVIMAAPLVHRGVPVGVIEVINPDLARGELVAIDMLSELAIQACLTLTLLQAARTITARTQEDQSPAAKLIAVLNRLDGPDADKVATALAAIVDTSRGR